MDRYAMMSQEEEAIMREKLRLAREGVHVPQRIVSQECA